MRQRVQADLLRWLMPAILLAYLILGGLYAVYTPDWQAPDEPAHYNYVAQLAARQRFPILVPGDYPAAYLEEIKAAHFPPGMSIAPIRYEFHQPPLYYLIAVPVYRLFGGALLPLRLLSVLLGALLLLVVYWTVREVVPARPYLALGAMAFVAFLPMHLTFAAAVNNDTLAELLLALVLLLTVRYCRAGFHSRPSARRLLVLMGIATGLGLLTKSSAYVALPLVLIAILARHLWIEPAGSGIPASVHRRPSRGLVPAAAAYALPAVVLAVPWWLRNLAVYGGLDWMGLGRHDLVVAGQLRTAEFVAQHGAGRLVHDLIVTTFQSFWGQFGWMGVLLDRRIYQALAILTALAAAGFVLWLVGAWRRRDRVPRWQALAGGLLALSGLFTLASYLWYNTQFLQHQGRYLFPALVPISLAVALGWHEALRRERALLLAGLLVAGAAVLWLLGARSTWSLLLAGAAAAALFVRRFLPAGWDPLVHALPYALLVPLDLACLFFFIVPQLAI